MEATTALPAVRINRLLPYWAVFQADFKQTANSWIYRFWVLLSMGAAIGYLLYRYGAMQVSGMNQPAPEMLGDLLRWAAFGSSTLVVVLTAGAICAERGTMADSVLSRGISRHQYFMGKWHARLVLILATYVVKSSVAVAGAYFLLHSEALTLAGSAAAMVTVGALLVCVVTCGVSVSALANNTVVSIAIAWLGLYGVGFLLSTLPAHIPTPDRTLHGLPGILKGHYDWQILGRLIVGSLAASLGMGVVAMFFFSRRDI